MRKEISGSSNIAFKFGCVLAMIISYTKWHSILWAMFHGVCSWLYVIYYAIYY